MRVRHRIPSIFNLSMVDVMCCALGSVILLWLINLRQAKSYEDETSALLSSTQKDRDGTYRKLLDLRTSYDTLDRERAALLKERADLTQARDALLKERADLTTANVALDRKLKDAGARVAALEGDVKDRTTRIAALTLQVDDLNKRLDAAGTTATSLRADLKATRDKLTAEEARLLKLLKELGDSTKTLELLRQAKLLLERDLESRSKDLAAALPFKDKLALNERKLSELEKLLAERGKELNLATQSVEAARQEKNIWQNEAIRARAAADNRFAGIALTGQRVIFLVDMSGSMDLVDNDTPAPNKWPEVCGTVGKVMKSLPDLRKYQVIVFAEKALFPLGAENQWLDYNGQVPDSVVKTLTAIKPKGGTNMYDALRAAFAYRQSGLDTIYLLSDGLPNLGEGVDPQVARTLKEIDLGERLGKHIRKTLNSDWNSARRPLPRVRINSIGFFYESPDIGSFLWALSRENDGSFVGMSKP